MIHIDAEFTFDLPTIFYSNMEIKSILDLFVESLVDFSIPDTIASIAPNPDTFFFGNKK